MDQFSAHLDRGWDLVQRGDHRGAELSARRALELDAESPEAFNLLGYVAALQGDFEDAVEHYQQAIALDDCYLEAMLNAAEIMIHPLGDFDAAEKMCEDALDLAESDDERVDALLLKFDSLLGRDLFDAAKELCHRFPPGPYENPAHSFLVGRAFYEIGEVSKAVPLIEEAVRGNAQNADAFYYLALVFDEQGRTPEATRAFLRSRELDLEAPRAPWAISSEEFVAAAHRAVAALDTELRRKVDLDELYVADVPGVEVILDGVDPRAVLLLDGVPALSDGDAEHALDPPAEGPLRVIVYRRNLERMAGSIELIEQEITDALDHELRTHFLAEAPPEPEPHRGLSARSARPR